jgi:hypothetical protein
MRAGVVNRLSAGHDEQSALKSGTRKPEPQAAVVDVMALHQQLKSDLCPPARGVLESHVILSV